MSDTILNKALTKKAIEITDRRRCSSCGMYRPMEGGKLLTGGHNVRRWMCSPCLEKRRVFLEKIEEGK